MNPERFTGAVSEYTTAADALDAGENSLHEQRYPDSLVDAVSTVVETDGSAADGAPVVVGLGETTHGTRECFQSKAGLIRLLVEECGVRTVAFEADVTATLALDAYVRRGEGDPAAALGGLHKWMWQVESIRDLLVWLRSFNSGRPIEDQVRVRGVDLSHPAAPAGPLRSYVEAVDPAYAATSDALAGLSALAGEPVPDDADARERVLDEAEEMATTLEQRLEAGRQSYIAAATERRWERARHLCRVVRRTCDWHRVRHEQPGPHAAGMQRRDRQMARNVEWCVRQDTGRGVAVWAHNIHIERGTFDDGRPWTDATGMGEFLAREFGARYTPVGFDTGGGTFRAVEAGDAGDRGPRQFTFDAPLEESATARFDAVGTAPWLLDIESAAADPRLDDWFDQPRRIRCVGTVYDPDAPDDHYLRTPLTSFDALVFLDRSTPSRPLGPTDPGE